MDLTLIEFKDSVHLTEKFNNMVSASALQLTLEKLTLFNCWCYIKEEYLPFSEKVIKICLPFHYTSE